MTKAGRAVAASPTLVGVDVRHGFHASAGGRSADLTIAATPETRRRLAALGLGMRERSDGFDLVWLARAPDSGRPVDPIEAATAVLATRVRTGALSMPLLSAPLLFTVATRNPDLAAITDMPIDLLGNAPPLDLSNARTGAADDGSADIVLDWARFVRGGLAASPAARPSAPVAAERTRFRTLWEGFALFELGLVRPNGATAIAGGFPIDPASAADPFTPCGYTLRLAARTTTWRYIVAARHGSLDAGSLAIVDARDGTTAPFDRLATPWPLPDGRLATCFVGRAPIALADRPEQRFALTGLPLGGRIRQRTLVPHLPAATAAHMAIDRAPGSSISGARSDPTVCSDIYVFI